VLLVDGIVKCSIAVHDDYGYSQTTYHTAEPEVTTFEGVRRGDFLVLGFDFDSLWVPVISAEGYAQ
jgi:hypothetical protein